MSFARAVFVATALMVAVLAGCLGNDAAELEQRGRDGDSGSGQPFTEDTGAVWVAVSSDQFMPLEGARVELLTMSRDATGQEAMTGPDGETTVRLVEPGEYIVYVSSIGFEASQRVVEVSAGQVSEVRVLMTPLPRMGPFSEEFDRAGHVTWAAAWQVEPPGVGCITIENPVGVLDPKSCGGVRGADAEAGETHVGPGASGQDGMSSDLENMKTLIVELRWNPAGPLGDNFLLDLLCSDIPRGAGGAVLDPEHDCYTVARGGSPLSIRVDEEHWLEHGYNFTGMWAARVFATYGMLGTHELTGVDVGVAYEQSFEKYWTVFHGEPAPEDYSRLPDV